MMILISKWELIPDELCHFESLHSRTQQEEFKLLFTRTHENRSPVKPIVMIHSTLTTNKWGVCVNRSTNFLVSSDHLQF